MRKSDVFFCEYPNKLSNKESGCRWFETPSGSYDITVMTLKVFVNIGMMVIYITNIVSYKYVHGSYRYYGFVLGLSLAFLKLFYRRRGRDMETFSALLAICAGNSPVPGEFPHKGKWRGALIFSLLCVWINGWVKNCEAGDLGRYRAHYDVILRWQKMISPSNGPFLKNHCIWTTIQASVVSFKRQN